MAWGDSSNPVRFGQGQHVSDDRNLFLKVFGGEVITAFQQRVTTLDKHRIRQITSGKSAQFPKVWTATSEYHTAGQEMLGNDIDTTEVTITVDGLLVAHTAIYDLDEKMSHFDVTSEFSAELGRELARAYDKNVKRAIIGAARTAADGPFPGGNVIEDAALINTASASGKDWFDAILEANGKLFDNDVPDDMQRYMLVNKTVFDKLRYATDANGNYLVANRDFTAKNFGIEGYKNVLEIDGVLIMPDRGLPSTDERAASGVYSKYQLAYDTTTAIMWCEPAVATVNLMDVSLETERDVRRQEDFMVAKMAVGHGTLRPECAVEFRSGAPTTT